MGGMRKAILPTGKPQAWFVFGARGEFSDATCWVVRVLPSEEAAKDLAARMTREIKHEFAIYRVADDNSDHGAMGLAVARAKAIDPTIEEDWFWSSYEPDYAAGVAGVGGDL